MNLTDFATDKYPLRPSKLDRLVKCDMYGVLSADMEEELGGPAAQTGNVVHEMVAAFHREPNVQRKVQAGLAIMASSLARFPDADPNEVRLFYTPYANDPRNLNARFATTGPGGTGPAGLAAIEFPVSLRLAAHPLDPTGRDIVVGGESHNGRRSGTLDQIRINPDTGAQEVWDLKTGKPTGWEMLHIYPLQLAAYTLAARQSGFPNAVLGGIIRAHGYRTKSAVLPSPEGVFWPMLRSVKGCETLLDKVRLVVALVRRGEVNFGSGVECNYCEFGGLQGCMPIAESRFAVSLL